MKPIDAVLAIFAEQNGFVVMKHLGISNIGASYRIRKKDGNKEYVIKIINKFLVDETKIHQDNVDFVFQNLVRHSNS